jgi:anaerobic selenocysteine-containing dehydrogenase
VGYTCVKGRAMPEHINGPARLLRSLRRSSDGFKPVAVRTAMDEIAARLSEILDQHGPRSIATYYGTQLQNVPAGPLMRAFSAAIGSDMKFGASSLDKPGRSIAWAMLGRWQAPPTGFSAPDVIMMVGINPLVNGLGGIPAGHPAHWLGERLASGTELIVVDPRRSDIAKRATMFLQPLVKGQEIEIESAHGKIVALVGLDDGLRDGSASMGFGFGGVRDDDHRQIHRVGSSIARLLSTRDYFDPYSGQPRMSAVPVRIRAATRPVDT